MQKKSHTTRAPWWSPGHSRAGRWDAEPPTTASILHSNQCRSDSIAIQSKSKQANDHLISFRFITKKIPQPKSINGKVISLFGWMEAGTRYTPRSTNADQYPLKLREGLICAHGHDAQGSQTKRKVTNEVNLGGVDAPLCLARNPPSIVGTDGKHHIDGRFCVDIRTRKPTEG